MVSRPLLDSHVKEIYQEKYKEDRCTPYRKDHTGIGQYKMRAADWV